jgi:hypothetical protein
MDQTSITEEQKTLIKNHLTKLLEVRVKPRKYEEFEVTEEQLAAMLKDPKKTPKLTD